MPQTVTSPFVNDVILFAAPQTNVLVADIREASDASDIIREISTPNVDREIDSPDTFLRVFY
jgi:ASC-1-like (ASCH) protein